MRVATRPVLLACALLVILAGAAWAEEAAGAEQAEQAGLTAADLEAWIQESPAALWALLILKYGVALIGLILLIRAWIRRDRVRAGLLPTPPARAEPTAPFDLSASLVLLGAAVLLGIAGSAGVAALDLDEDGRLMAGMGVLQGILLLVAAVVIVRRRRLGAGPRRSPGTVIRMALWTFCVASAFVIPVMFLSVAVLQALEVPITLYGPVEKVVEGEATTLPWVILLLSVVAAPIAEESLFRGMLYPAIRRAVGARHGVLAAAVVTSALFALIHWHAASFLPLFTLAMVFALVFERTNSLATAIGAHALWNASTMLPLLMRGLA
jgi:membrane protease YdiL (CAAX protease family)